jgi:hypothetical protein
MELKTERQFQYGLRTTPRSNGPEPTAMCCCAKRRSEVANHGTNKVSAVFESGSAHYTYELARSGEDSKYNNAGAPDHVFWAAEQLKKGAAQYGKQRN